ncbi:MAG TPA: PH domain-containing protein [Gemmatimonadaceae bacterium]|nr:PH domain-containing protein [Gemmatimonadaceae bacterium]
MSYVDKSLIPGEQVVYRATLYRLPFFWLIVPAVAAFAAAVFHVWLVVLAAIIVAGLIFVNVWARRAATELAVTNKRVIIAMGAVRRRTIELMLDKVEGIQVEQTVPGRVFNYGTVIIMGSGGTHEAFDHIGAPLEFRRQVQAQLALKP